MLVRSLCSVRERSRYFIGCRIDPVAGSHLEAVPVGHRDSAGDAADDANEALVGAANEKILQVRAAVELFLRRAVYRAIVVAGETHDCGRSEHIGIDDA